MKLVAFNLITKTYASHEDQMSIIPCYLNAWTILEVPTHIILFSSLLPHSYNCPTLSYVVSLMSIYRSHFCIGLQVIPVETGTFVYIRLFVMNKKE